MSFNGFEGFTKQTSQRINRQNPLSPQEGLFRIFHDLTKQGDVSWSNQGTHIETGPFSVLKNMN